VAITTKSTTVLSSTLAGERLLFVAHRPCLSSYTPAHRHCSVTMSSDVRGSGLGL
jgi:hypothetical protein